MEKRKIEDWLSIAERGIALIKPKFHNAITRTVVCFGLTLMIESQVNILEAFGVALFESFFGSSEYLRNLFSSDTNSWVGLVLVILSLIYNAVVTVGLELISKYKSSIPKLPKLTFSMLNSDSEVISDEYQMRGTLCSTNIDPIPDKQSYSETYQEERPNSHFLSMGLASPFMPGEKVVNKDFYRERAKLLKVWGASEVFKLKVINEGDALAKNVRVMVELNKHEGTSVKNDNDLHPTTPLQEKEETIYSFPNRNIPYYDIKKHENAKNHAFEWEVGDLQAKDKSISITELFLRIESDIEFNISIYSDELSEPVKSVCKIYPPRNRLEFDLNLLMLNEKDFFERIDPFIMNGFIGKYYDRLLAKYTNKDEELIPE